MHTFRWTVMYNPNLLERTLFMRSDMQLHKLNVICYNNYEKYRRTIVTTDDFNKE